MADRMPDGSGFMHDGRFWPRGHGHGRGDNTYPCYLCGWGPHRAIHSVPPGTEPHGPLGLHSFRSRGPELEGSRGVRVLPTAHPLDQFVFKWVCGEDSQNTDDFAQAKKELLEVIEAQVNSVAAEWDGCFYENAIGGDIDIGEAIRTAFAAGVKGTVNDQPKEN